MKAIHLETDFQIDLFFFIQILPERVNEILEEARERILALEAERDNLQKHLDEKQQVKL